MSSGSGPAQAPGGGDEVADLERVLTRLALIDNDARLETVLANLLPRLVERLEVLSSDSSPDAAKAKEVIINIFTHVFRWVKAPSNVKLPIEALAYTIKTKLDKGPGMRVAMTLIEIGFDRVEDDAKSRCMESLLDVHERLVGSQNRLVRLLLPGLVPKFSRQQLERYKDYFVDLALDCCYPPGFFPLSHPRNERLVGSDRAAPTLDECAARAKAALTILGNFAEWNPALSPDALAAGVLCSSTWPRDDVKRSGEDLVKLIRDQGLQRVEREPEIRALFNLILGSPQRPKAPVNAGIKAMEALPRFYVGSSTREGLLKVIVSGLLGTDQPVQVRIQTLKLIAESTDAYPAEDSQAENFLSKILKQLVTGNVDHLTSDHRAALMNAFARWTSSRSTTLKALLCTRDVALQLINAMIREHEIDAIDAEFRCLTIVGEYLENGAEDGLMTLEPLIDAVEFATSTSKLKTFTMFLARRALLSCSDSARSLTAIAIFIICMACRPNEPRHQRDAYRRDFERLLELPKEQLPTFDDLLSFVRYRERQWGDREAPKDYFFPVLFQILSLPPLLLDADNPKILALWQNRVLDAMLNGGDDTKLVCANATVVLINSGRITWDEIDTYFRQRMTSLSTWTVKQLGSTSETLRRSCAQLARFEPSGSIANFVQERLLRTSGLDFDEAHGAFCAAAAMAESSMETNSMLLQAVSSFVLTSPFRTHRPLRNEAFVALAAYGRRGLFEGQNELVIRLVHAARDALKEKSADDAMEGPIAFVGLCASMDDSSISEDAFSILMSLTGDSRFGIDSQHAIGKSLSFLASSKLTKVIDHVLDNTVFAEASQKARTSAAVLLEEIALDGSQRLFESGDIQVILRMVDGCLDLFGEPEELARLSACSTLFLLSLNARAANRLDSLTHALFRGLEIRRGLGAAADRGSNDSSTGQEQAPSTNATQPDAQRPRLDPSPRPRPRRRGEDDRAWGYFDLALACQQSGIGSLAFALFGVVGLAPEQSALRAKAIGLVRSDLQRAPSLSRLAVQFLRRRHLPQQEVSSKAAEEVWNARLKDECIFESTSIMETTWNECTRLLQDSFLSKERRSACLMLSEMAARISDDAPFPCAVETAWRIVYRALDDLDESIASGPALSLGRGVKRRTLVGLRVASTSDERSAEMSAVFDYLLDSGIGHPAKPARDLTRAFLVDAITQEKLPWRMACPVIEALLRTIGESELMLLQYAQFHTRGGAGTGEIPLDAHQLEEIRAKLALDTPELKAAVKLASSLKRTNADALLVAKDLVTTVARSVRTGLGLTTLVAAVEMARFLSSEEWNCSPDVIVGDVGANLLSALSQRFNSDPSHELKRRIAASAANVSLRIQSSSPVAVERYSRMLASEYEDDPEASEEKRKLAAIGCYELIKRGVTHLHASLLRACFLGRFDPDAAVAQDWRNAFENGLSGLIDNNLIVDFVGNGVNSAVYRIRKAAAASAIALSKPDLQMLAQSPQGLELVRLACASGTPWEGKDTVIRAVGHVFAHAVDVELAEYALNQLMDFIFVAGATENKQQEQPRWLREASFEAIGTICERLNSEDGSIPTARLNFIRKLIAHFPSSETIVIAAALKSLSKALEQATVADMGVVEAILKLLIRVLSSTPTWNVRANAYEAVAQFLPSLPSGQSMDELLRFVSITLEEEKKPSVLLPALRCVLAAKKLARTQSGANESIKRFLSVIQNDLKRLESNADVSVGRLAHSILQEDVS